MNDTTPTASESRRKLWLTRALGVGLGTGAGFAMYALVGCNTASCGLLSNPWSASALGAALGFFWSSK